MDVHLLTIARNESGRYWRSALEAWLEFADDVLYLDDGSTDATPDIAAEYEDVIEILPDIDADGMWGQELQYRRALFNFAVDNTEPGDVLVWMDADMAPIADPSEFFSATSDGPLERSDTYVPPDVEAWSFPLYDFWSLDEIDRRKQRERGRFMYRSEEPFWVADSNPRVWAIRTPDADPTDFEWGDVGGIHTGHIPKGYFIHEEPRTLTVPRSHGIGHWGYWREADRRGKFDRYADVRDQLSDFQWQHAKTITDEHPELTPLHEDVELELTYADE